VFAVAGVDVDQRVNGVLIEDVADIQLQAPIDAVLEELSRSVNAVSAETMSLRSVLSRVPLRVCVAR
jgi:hypothetical protein